MQPASHNPMHHILPPFILWAISAIVSSTLASALVLSHPAPNRAQAVTPDALFAGLPHSRPGA